jgi:hypothetical protein
MNCFAWVDPRIERVSVDNVRAYLLSHGWRQRPYQGIELLVFEGPLDDRGEPIILVLPSSRQASDFRLRVEDLIGALCVIEDRPAALILTDFLAAVPAYKAAE